MALQGKTYQGELPIQVVENPLPITGYFVNGEETNRHLPLTFDKEGRPKMAASRSSRKPSAKSSSRRDIERQLIGKYPVHIIEASMTQLSSMGKSLTPSSVAKHAQSLMSSKPRSSSKARSSSKSRGYKRNGYDPEKIASETQKIKQAIQSSLYRVGQEYTPEEMKAEIDKELKKIFRTDILETRRVVMRNILLNSGSLSAEELDQAVTQVMEQAYPDLPSTVQAERIIKKVEEGKRLTPQQVEQTVLSLAVTAGKASPYAAPMMTEKAEKIAEKLDDGKPLTEKEKEAVIPVVTEIAEEASAEVPSVTPSAQGGYMSATKRGSKQPSRSQKAKEMMALEQNLKDCKSETSALKKEIRALKKQDSSEASRDLPKQLDAATKKLEKAKASKKKAAKAPSLPEGTVCETIPNHGKELMRKDGSRATYADAKVANIGDRVRLKGDPNRAEFQAVLMGITKQDLFNLRYDTKKNKAGKPLRVYVRPEKVVRQAAASKAKKTQKKSTSTTSAPAKVIKAVQNPYHNNPSVGSILGHSGVMVGSYFGSGILHAGVRWVLDRFEFMKKAPTIADTVVGVVSMGTTGAVMSLLLPNHRASVFGGLAGRFVAHLGRSAPQTIPVSVRQLTGGSPMMTLEGILEETDLGAVTPIVEVEPWNPKQKRLSAQGTRQLLAQSY